MPLLQDLVLELQQRLGEAPPVPPTAAVADAASSERINVTLPRGVMDDLKRHALEEGRSCVLVLCIGVGVHMGVESL